MASTTAAPTPAQDPDRPVRDLGLPPVRDRSPLERVTEPVVRTLELWPLRVRLVAIVVVLLCVALTVSSAATAYLMRRDLVSRVDRDLRLVAQPVAQQALNQLASQQQVRLPTGYAVVFLPTNGAGRTNLNPTTEPLHPDVPDIGLDDARVTDPHPFTIGSEDGPMQWRAIAGKLRDNSATFVVAVPLREVERTVSRLVFVTLLIGLAVIILCAVTGWYAVRRAFRPLTRIEDTASAIAEGDLTQRIPTPAADDEVTSLARSLNAMLAHIEHSFAVREASEEKMRRFVADASHELRTPLATVRGYAELYRQGAVSTPEDVASAMGRIEGEARRMGVLVEDLLLLARLDDQRPLDVTDVDLTVLAADAAQDARARAPERRITVTALSGELAPTLVRGDESRLRQVLGNLLANALNHTPPGTPVEVLVGADPASGSARLEVRDHGLGIDTAQAARVFERFFRSDPSRRRGRGGGNGLGLAIVAAIVHAHHGRVGVAETPGGGATFVVQLPTANSQTTSSDG